MLKKIFVAVLAVAFVAGFFANFNSVADAASHVWRCSNCGGQTTSKATAHRATELVHAVVQVTLGIW